MPVILFDRALVRRNRVRAVSDFPAHDFLFREAAETLADRLSDVRRDFARGIEIGARGGLVASALEGRGKRPDLIGLDLDARLLPPGRPGIVADEEALPLASASIDLIISCLALHWVNDLPGTLLQIRRALRPGGLFLGSLFGGGTLNSLRQAFLEAESEVTGGVSPRLAPMADIRDLGGLMQRAGFDQPVVDSEVLTVSYENPLSLLSDLRGMGEGNVLLARSKKPLRRAVLFRMAQLLKERFSDADGRIPVRFEVLTLTGWAA
ncbi:MAG: methyltransferase domain-containing protein [Alphaproteobacteria bacterium]|nr:methyltransferase domain-containing protein [Alphaproteobacteria bacterium]